MKQIYLFLVLVCTTTGMFAVNDLTTPVTFDVQTISTHSNKHLQDTGNLKASYIDNTLTIIGKKNDATIEVYNLLGRKVVHLEAVNINGRYTKQLALPINNIYIVKISAEAFSKSFKIVAK